MPHWHSDGINVLNKESRGRRTERPGGKLLKSHVRTHKRLTVFTVLLLQLIFIFSLSFALQLSPAFSVNLHHKTQQSRRTTFKQHLQFSHFGMWDLFANHLQCSLTCKVKSLLCQLQVYYIQCLFHKTVSLVQSMLHYYYAQNVILKRYFVLLFC